MDELLPVGARAANRLRVALFSLHTSPTASLGQRANGGMNVYIREIVTAFAKRGIATDVFTREPGPGRRAVERLGSGGRVIYLPAGAGDLDKYALLQVAEPFAEAALRLADQEGCSYDLVYSHYWLSGVAGLRFASELALPWIHTAHTLGLVKNRQLARGAAPEPPARIAAEKMISCSADLLVVSTESEGRDLVGCYGADPARIAVVAPGVDLGRFRPHPKRQALRRLGREGQRFLLFVGRLERLKGVEIALRAFAMSAVGGHADVRFLILGEDSRDATQSERERLQGLAVDLGISNRVDFLGSVPHEQLCHYYAAAEACLMPSYSESFGLVGLEAQACGCPVIASDVAGLASVIRDQVTGYLISSDEPSAYARRIGHLLDHPELADQMGRRGILLAQRFPWTRTADRLLSEIDGLCAAHQGRLQASARQE